MQMSKSRGHQAADLGVRSWERHLGWRCKCVCLCVALVDLDAVGWTSQTRERGETPGLSLKVFLHLLNNSPVLSLFFSHCATELVALHNCLHL